MRYKLPYSLNNNPNIERYDSNSIKKPFLINIKYPTIPLDFTDTYVYTNRGDRYDILANEYYGDSKLWWIISRSNSSFTQDSLIPPVGSQIRIPNKSRIGDILSAYESLNT